MRILSELLVSVSLKLSPANSSETSFSLFKLKKTSLESLEDRPSTFHWPLTFTSSVVVSLENRPLTFTSLIRLYLEKQPLIFTSLVRRLYLEKQP